MDVLITNIDEVPALLRNGGVAGRHWLGVAVEGRASNRDGIGASLVARAVGLAPQTRYAMPTGSYLSSSNPRVHFGLGAAREVDLGITWPSGLVEHHERLAVDRYVRVVEESAVSPIAEAVNGWASREPFDSTSRRRLAGCGVGPRMRSASASRPHAGRAQLVAALFLVQNPASRRRRGVLGGMRSLARGCCEMAACRGIHLCFAWCRDEAGRGVVRDQALWRQRIAGRAPHLACRPTAAPPTVPPGPERGSRTVFRNSL